MDQIGIIKDDGNRLETHFLFEKHNLLVEKIRIFSFSSNKFCYLKKNHKIYLYVPLTTVDVKKSFIKLVWVLDDLKKKLLKLTLGPVSPKNLLKQKGNSRT